MNNLKILIAGGGIGGLTTALCLAKYGHEVQVFEQNPQFAEIGAGIQLSPNCTQVLHFLGLEPALRSVAFLPQGTQFRHWRTARVIAESSLGQSAVERYGAPYYHIHRGDLLRILVTACEAMSNIELHLGASVHEVQQGPEGVTALVHDQTHPGDLLIGADGIHSVIREVLFGQASPRFTGNIAWRALVPTERLAKGLVLPMSTAWWGPGKHFVHYYVRQGEQVNCVCVVEKAGWQTESWTEPGEYDELKADFAGWHANIQQLIDNADRDSLFKWALFDRPPMPRWSVNRVTLLGDACHPTLPFMAQGAAMAIEDAAVLAGCLDKGTYIPDSLRRYEDLRRDRTAGIQNGSRRNSKTFHLQGVKAWLRDRAVRTAGARTMDKLYRYKALSAADQH